MRSMILAMKKHFYLVIIAMVILSIVLSFWLSSQSLSQILAVSIFSKECVLAVIPLIIFGCSYRCMYQLKQYGILLLTVMLLLIMTSNFISSWIGYGISHVTLTWFTIPDLSGNPEGLTPAWLLTFPKWIKNEIALISGLVLGLFSRALFHEQLSSKLNQVCVQMSTILMDYFLLPILPIFMMGFIIKLIVDGSVSLILQQCGMFAMVLVSTYCVYLCLGYLFVHKGNIQKAVYALARILPAGWVGFSTMSSMAALPLNLAGSGHNTRHKNVVGGVLPISTNIHLVGDSIGIPMMAMLILFSFTGTWPSVLDYGYFALMLVLAKFSVAAVPAGGIIVLLPVLNNVFGFSPEMSALITIMYIVLDPIITATNVIGNGLFVIVVDKTWDKIQKIGRFSK